MNLTLAQLNLAKRLAARGMPVEQARAQALRMAKQLPPKVERRQK